ncbi:MAG: elongation factor G [Candidatus Aminicenantes bacterium]|nr:elongation factor G [Candidatus Aminicenantes bacterium]
MKSFSSEHLRNIALIGHGSTGKTSLVSAVLFNTQMINRLAKVEQGNTVTDYDEDEIEKKISIQAAVAFAHKDKYKINMIDTPGFANFIWEARVGLRAVETGVMLVSATEGVEVQTEKIFEYAEELNKSMIFVINKMTKEFADFDKAFDSIVESFGKNAVPVQYPIGSGADFTGVIDVIEMKAYKYSGDEKGDFEETEIPADLKDTLQAKREELIEKIAENDEALMEKYFEDGDLSLEDIAVGLKAGILNRNIFPVLVTDALTNIGVNHFVDFVTKYTPSIIDVGETAAVEGTVKPDQAAPFSSFVFKTISDPYTGKISLIKVLSGVFKPDSSYVNVNKEASERVGGLFFLQGKEQASGGDVHPGDIVAVAKLKETQTGDTLTVKGNDVRFPEIKFPIPSISFAIEPKTREDENKISVAFQKICEEDPTIKSLRDPQTKELVISGNGQLHVELVVNKLKKRYGVEVEMKPPRIPYLETISGKADVNIKHKKQSGGRGQYGHVMIKMDPQPRGSGFVFEDTIFGGSIPKNYIPAVEKGIREVIHSGILAGYQVVDFKVNLYDGSYHDVDSSDMAFKIAASKAFKQGMKEAKPTLLEPIVKVEVVTPEEFMGDINGNLSGRRGKIQGMSSKGKNTIINAMVPMVEMLDFNPNLISITGGRGSYFMEFDHYEEVPAHLQTRIIADARKEGRVREVEEE